jgi:cation diffusion facilitator family transporter
MFPDAPSLALGSLVLGVAVLSLKYVAYLLTGSIAMYSDALESIINVVAAGAAFLAVRISLKPADTNHPYGHHKAEYFSAVLEGVFIGGAALAIFMAAWQALFEARTLDFTPLGMGVSIFATLLNALWSRVLFTRGRALASVAMVADAKHIWSDVVSTLGVLAGVTLAMLSGWHILDPLLAIAVAFNILWSGWHLVRNSLSALMDEAVPPPLQKKINTMLKTAVPEALGAHDIRTRMAAQMVFVDFHLVVPGAMTVRDSHALCDRLEHGLCDLLAKHGYQSMATIHVEPEEHQP